MCVASVAALGAAVSRFWSYGVRTTSALFANVKMCTSVVTGALVGADG